jgi:hypothetical protein
MRQPCSSPPNRFAFLCLTALALAACFHASLTTSAAAQDLPPEPRAVLDRFLGRWETAATIRKLGAAPREIRTKGEGVCTATIEGRYYEFRTATIPAGDSELQVMTYDPEAKVYRQWVFSSDGYSHTADGIWNAATSTLRWTGKSGTQSFVIDDHFVAPGQLDWTLERKDAAGNVVQTITGQLRRVAKP